MLIYSASPLYITGIDLQMKLDLTEGSMAGSINDWKKFIMKALR